MIRLYIFGCILTLGISVFEALRGTMLNFQIFQEATIDYWNGLNPYVGWADRHNLDVFLYLPPFLPIFSPFAILPQWLGSVVWNFFNYNLLFLAICLLPGIDFKKQRFIFLFPIALLAQTIFSFQYNLFVAYIFLFTFIMLERKQYWWALVLALLSGTTKVYGLFELSLFIIYPQFWKNVGRGSIVLILLLLLPMINTSVDGILSLYKGWFDAITLHQYRPFETMTRLILQYTNLNIYDYGNALLGFVTLAVTILIFIYKKSLSHSLALRYQVLGIIMSTIILWGTNSERHTYLIAVIGYAIWYVNIHRHTLLDKILLTLCFVVLGIMPIDILCPRPIMFFVFNTLAFNILLYLIIWSRMLYVTFNSTLRLL